MDPNPGVLSEAYVGTGYTTVSQMGALLVGIVQVGTLPVWLVSVAIKPDLPSLNAGEQGFIVFLLFLGAANIATFRRY